MFESIKRFICRKFFVKNSWDKKEDLCNKTRIFLDHDKYSYLSHLSKKYIIENIGDIIVQDPTKEKNPSILFIKKGHKHMTTVRKLLGLIK